MSLVVGLTSYRSHDQPWHSWVKLGHQLNKLILALAYRLIKLLCFVKSAP